MEKIKERCCICDNDIDEYAYYVTEDKKYFCSRDCAEKAMNELNFEGNIWDMRFCPAYDYCKQLNKLRKICDFKNNIA